MRDKIKNAKTQSMAERMSEVCRAIESDLAAPLRTATLARDAGMAQHHFQRQFARVTGETVAGYIKSRRLERAALALQETKARVIDIALDVGFQTHAALTRAFTAHFGCTPHAFRMHGLTEERQGLPPRPFLLPLSSRALNAQCDLVDVPDQWLCYRTSKGVRNGRYFGDLAAINHCFQELWTEIDERAGEMATAFPEGPRGFDDPSATAHYGVLLSQDKPLDWSTDRRLLPGGLFAVFPHFGPYAGLHLTWHRFVRAGFDQLGLSFRKAWMYETYLSANPNAPETELSALIYFPVTQKSTNGKAGTLI
ncbi:AraC family transcriptional regulator [uncultured Roseobacter sp.]|uniref:AraC family transcriptional regulator n=1 Tax=uncultured Roseobacter sp. TaxID=114847 RepID=UPI0026280989|nr:AraC family transcriptional regulator [uncultured Roseobacter sp.]